MVEDGTAIHKLSVVLSHCSGSRLGVEEPIVAVLTQLREEEGIVLVRLHLLERRSMRKRQRKMVEYGGGGGGEEESGTRREKWEEVKNVSRGKRGTLKHEGEGGGGSGRRGEWGVGGGGSGRREDRRDREGGREESRREERGER